MLPDLGVLLWIGGGALLLLGLGVALVCWPVRLELNARARGESNGSWVAGGGVSFAFFSVAFVGAKGMSPKLTLLLFGRRFDASLPLGERLTRPLPERVKSVSRRAWQRLAPLELGLKLLEERRHLRLRYLVIDLEYGFRDPLLTGRLVGALYALSGVLPRSIELRQRPRWDFEDGWEVAADGRALVKPWLILLDVGAYVIKRAVVRSETEREHGARERPSEAS